MPKKIDKEPLKILSIGVNPQLLERIEEAAQEKTISISAFVRLCILEYLKDERHN